MKHDSRLMKRGNVNATLVCQKSLRASGVNLDVFVLIEGIRSGADNAGQEQTRLSRCVPSRFPNCALLFCTLPLLLLLLFLKCESQTDGLGRSG